MTTTNAKPGTVALETLKSLAVRVHGPAGSPEAFAAMGEIHTMQATERARCERLEAAVANALKHDDALKPEYQIPASLRREMAAALAGEGTK